MKRLVASVAMLAAALAVLYVVRPWGRAAGRLADVGPRLVSNSTRYSLDLYGLQLPPRGTLVLGAPWNNTVPFVGLDATHAVARLPEGPEMPAATDAWEVPVSLRDESDRAVPGERTLTVVNDRGLPAPIAAVVGGSSLFVAVPETDEVWVYARADGASRAISVGDGPCGLAIAPARADRKAQLAVVHRYDGELRLLDVDDPGGPQTRVAVGVLSRGVATAGHRAFVTDEVNDDVAIVDLDKRRVIERRPVGLNPSVLATDPSGDWLAVGNLGGADITLFSPSGKREGIAPEPNVTILGGRTAKYSREVMGGKSPRALAFSARLGALFVSSVGPNIGPNADRMEVSMNPGVGVIDARSGRFLRHLSVEYGTLEGLALDDTRGLLYAADIATGRILVFSTDRLVQSDATAKEALLGQLGIEPDANMPLFRPLPELSEHGRAGVGVHSGPYALALDPEGATLYAVSRHVGTVWEVDVSKADHGTLAVRRQFPGVRRSQQLDRLKGQALYFSDLGKTGISCDSCHRDGHMDTVLFEKTTPLRIYRVSTLRWIRESAPYFNPSNQATLEDTVDFVMKRNRFGNPAPSRGEVVTLGRYQSLMVGPPNPYRLADGRPPEYLDLPDGRRGQPASGRALYEGKAGCASGACHAAPHFTGDQNSATRGTAPDIGGPISLPLRVKLQDLRVVGVAPPSLLGVWDNSPLLLSGAGGLTVVNDSLVKATQRFPLREVFRLAGPKHGKINQLTPQEQDDLLAYLLTL